MASLFTTNSTNNFTVNTFGLSTECRQSLGGNFKSTLVGIVMFVAAVLLSNILHYLLRPLSQPRITSETFVGMLIANLPFVPREIIKPFTEQLDFVIDFGMMLYMFVLGLEMDPYALFRRPTLETKVAYAGVLSTFILAGAITPFLHYFPKAYLTGGTIALAAAASGTASPVLTRVITSLKIGKSDIGRLVVGAGMQADLVASLVLCIVYVFYHERKEHHDQSKRAFAHEVIITLSAIVIQTIFTAKVSPMFMNWINNENPEGKPLKGSHLVLTIAFMVAICSISTLCGYNAILSAFLTGIFVPRQGRMSKWGVGKINYLLSTFFNPVFFFWMGLHSKLKQFQIGHRRTWARLGALLLITVAGKIVGIVAGGLLLGFHWPESVSLGLLLAVKGHFHVFLAMVANRDQIVLTPTTGVVMVFVIFITVVYCPSVVAYIISRARKRSPKHRMSLQLLDPANELRILLCVHGPQNLPSTLNFMEISRGAPQPGMSVYVTDMIELTSQIAETLVLREGTDSVTVSDNAVTDIRDQVTAAVEAYVQENGQGIRIQRMLALSTFNNMPEDICHLAEYLTVALIILPFHKSQRADGRLDEGQSGFRYVNRKVIRHAPCSVGILVDRGFGLIENISTLHVTLNVAVIFIGGKDDREALSYSKRVARHPGVKLTVLRFLVETSGDDASRRAENFGSATAEQEEEMKLDDECFAQFYERYVVGGRIAYLEKHLANSAETFSTLRSLEGQYSLVIVGRGGRVNSVLTVGMNDWQQCPELGPIGDILSGSDFSATTSVLVIQQHNLKGELEGLEDDFRIM